MNDTTTTKSKDPKPAEATASATAATTRADLRSRITKQGPEPERRVATSGPSGEPGIYRVKHGRICLGHVDGDSVYANTGAEVELTAEEAGRMLADGTVEFVPDPRRQRAA